MISPQKHEVFNMEEVYAIDNVPDYNWKLYKAALMYVELGYRVLPVAKNGKAIPSKRYQISYVHASNRIKTVEKWFHPTEGMFAGWNIGLATGREDGIFVIDVDRHGPSDGVATLEDILSQQGDDDEMPQR